MFKIKRDTLSDVPHVVSGLSCVPSVASGKAELVGLFLQLPVAVVTTATAAAIRAAATGCLGFFGHDVGCNVLHFLSLLVQRTLGYAAFTKRSD